MRTFTTSILGCFALVGLACSDGSAGLSNTSGGVGPTTGSGGDNSTGTSATGSSGSSDTTTGASGDNSSGAGGAVGAGGMTSGSGGTGVMPMGDSGVVATPDAGIGGPKTGPFKILVLSTTIEFHHDSIPAGLQMLKDLGMSTAPERAKANAPSDSTWTVDRINTCIKANDPDPDTGQPCTPAPGGYFSEVTDANLAKYEMVYSDNPTGQVFTLAPDSATHEAAFEKFMNNGGAWAGQHSATDFENQSKFVWFQSNVDGAWFVGHDGDGTNGTINWESTQTQHPILKGIPSPWNCTDEWYKMSKDVSAVPGFTVLGKVTVPNSQVDPNARPAVWIRDPPTGGRSFYTIRGHNKTVYAEPAFRQLVLQGILWATHRLK